MSSSRFQSLYADNPSVTIIHQKVIQGPAFLHKVQTLLHVASHLYENSLAWKSYPGRSPACPVNWILPNGPSVSCASFGGSWFWIWHKGGPGVVGECYLGHGSSVSDGLARKLLFPWQLSQPHLQFKALLASQHIPGIHYSGLLWTASKATNAWHYWGQMAMHTLPVSLLPDLVLEAILTSAWCDS